MNSDFGKYDVPRTLQKLIDLESVLGDSESFYHGFSFYLSFDALQIF